MLAKDAGTTNQMQRIGKLQGMSFQSWIDRTMGIVLTDVGRSQRIARDQGLKKGRFFVGAPPSAGEFSPELLSA